MNWPTATFMSPKCRAVSVTVVDAAKVIVASVTLPAFVTATGVLRSTRTRASSGAVDGVPSGSMASAWTPATRAAQTSAGTALPMTVER